MADTPQPSSLYTERSSDAWQCTVTCQDGIERIEYVPAERRFRETLLFVHGMWHGAWCWQPWQEQLAERGWQSVAFSLPGHGGSAPQRHFRWCTLGYYGQFLRAEIARLSPACVLVGHSMGGALLQHYLKSPDVLPQACVLVGSWTSHSTFGDGLLPLMKLDPAGAVLVNLTLSANAYVRNPVQTARRLISADALISAEELHSRMDPESILVLNQHNPPLWFPAKSLGVPALWIAGELDAVVTAAGQRSSAEHYGAEFMEVAGAGHNLMMEANQSETCAAMAGWLETQLRPGDRGATA